MYGTMHSVSEDAQTTGTTAFDIAVLTVGADRVVVLHELRMGQTSDLGDANEEVLRIGFFTGATAGTAGTGLTETPLNAELAVSDSTWTGFSDTESSGGTRKALIPWNIRLAGSVWIATPEARVIVSQANDPFAIRTLAGPADAITYSMEIIYEEI
jgi:hypothetical protein